MNSRTQFGQPIIFIDPDFNIRKCSKSVMSILEHTDESELVGHKCHQLFYNLDSPCRGCPVSRAVVLKTIVEQELYTESFNGRHQIRTAVATPLQNADGIVQHLIMDCLGDDISIHKKEKSVESLVDQSIPKKRSFPSSQSVLLDRDMSIILFNKGMKSLLATENMDIIGHNIFTVAPYYNRPEIRNRLEKFIYRDEKMATEFETDDTLLGGGRTRHQVEKMDGHGHLDAVLLRSVAIGQSTGDDKKYFKQHLKMLSQFAGRMAHDVKNALALISTNADFIYSEAPETDMTGKGNNISQYAEIIQKHVKQIVGIVEDANSLKVHNWDTIAESDLAQLLNRVVTITQLSKPYISHDVSLKIGNNLPRIITSELYLERALTELVKSILLNAEESSPLRISVKHDAAEDYFLILFNCRQQTNLFSDLESKLQQFFTVKKQWEPAMLGLFIAYAAVLIQDGSMQTTLLDNGEFQIILKLPRAPRTH